MDSLKIPLENVGEVSDGYHTFNELYDHRVTLFIALCRKIAEEDFRNNGQSVGEDEILRVWKSKLHADGSKLEGWFVMGIYKEEGKQITYHLPLDRWDETDFANTMERGPDFDGHAPEDVLKRLKEL